jgi:hypothetical protein
MFARKVSGALLVVLSACGANDSRSDHPAGTGGAELMNQGGSAGIGGSLAARGGTGGAPPNGAAGGARANGGAATGGGAPSAGAGSPSSGSAGGSARGGSASTGSGGAAGQTGAAGEGGALASSNDCSSPAWAEADFAHVYDVGPNEEYATPSDVPWESLEAGTLVRIHRRAEPYRDKWVLNARGTAEHPIVVLGVPEAGALPVISGDQALTRESLDFWNEERGIIKVGGASVPDAGAAYVHVECLDIQRARPGTHFTSSNGDSVEYVQNAACVYLEAGEHITIANNLIHGCGNGIFASSGSTDVLIRANFVYDNGIESGAFQHNSYTEASGITFEFNHYGPLCAGCDGNNLKDRSAGTVIRYNWIESGNRQLDLVESDFDELIADARYRETFVYGNVLIEPDAGNSQIVHYGGDGDDSSKYRKGTLFFYFNTVVSTRAGNTTLFRLSSEEESVDARNNIFFVSGSGSALAASAGMGKVSLSTNFLPTGWVKTHDTLTGTVSDMNTVLGATPGFTNVNEQDFSLVDTSNCLDRAGSLPAVAEPPLFQYAKHQSLEPRFADGKPDLGAFERGP